jgi:ribosomal protein S18 acetylase RimI-like enzyme
MIRYELISRDSLPGIISLCEAEGYKSYTEDAELTWRALNAPGVTTMVAVEGDRILGLAQMQSDGHIQVHLSLVVVDAGHRRQGIGRKLVEGAFSRAGGKRVDLVTDTADDFYRSFKYQDHWHGYRIYPGHEE